jgi:gas vesicle protein
MSEHDSDFGNFFAGFIIGGLVGAATALLLAPQSGEETRAVIREKSIELKEKAYETAEETRERAEAALEDARIRAEQAYEEVRARAEELADVSRERAHEFQEQGKRIVDEQRAKITHVVETGKKAAEAARDTAREEMQDPPPTVQNPPVPKDQTPGEVV